jgi:NADP-dependent 3-hydroxy acid dehydrogenase YdfG
MLDHRYDNIRVCSIMPGSVDTEFTGDPAKRAGAARTGDTSWMIAPEDVAETVGLVLRIPARTMISRVEIRPSRPKK